MQASRNTHWRLDRALRRAHLHHRRVTSAKAAALRPESLLRDSTTTRSSRRTAFLVGGADERVAARDPAASVTRLFTAQCALDCSLFEWCFGRRARARRDDRLDRSTAPHRTAPHRTGGPDVAVRTVSRMPRQAASPRGELARLLDACLDSTSGIAHLRGNMSAS